MNARKLIGTVVLGAALFVPVAQAQSPDDRPGPRGPGAIAALQSAASTHPDNRAVRGVGAQAPNLLLADDRAGIRPAQHPTRLSAARTDFSGSTHPDNRADARGPGAIERTIVVGSTSTGFDWGDALIGGLGGIGTALLLTGCLFLLMSQRNKTRVA